MQNFFSFQTPLKFLKSISWLLRYNACKRFELHTFSSFTEIAYYREQIAYYREQVKSYGLLREVTCSVHKRPDIPTAEKHRVLERRECCSRPRGKSYWCRKLQQTFISIIWNNGLFKINVKLVCRQNKLWLNCHLGLKNRIRQKRGLSSINIGVCNPFIV